MHRIRITVTALLFIAGAGMLAENLNSRSSIEWYGALLALAGGVAFLVSELIARRHSTR
jgi:hypothetical protein